MIEEIIKMLENSSNTLKVENEKLILLSDVKYILGEYLGDNNIKKEEYLNMVDVLHQENDYIVDKFVKRFSLDDYISSTDYENALEYCVKELKKLIEEHFKLEEDFEQLEKSYDNLYDKFHNLKPLKFEELHEGMWVWDNVSKRYMKIYDISYSEEGFNVNGEWYLDDLYLEEFNFEENRFYRREVKEELERL